MNRRISAVVLCLALAPLSRLSAEAESGPVSRTPLVESAVVPPTDVELPAAPDPEVLLRLEDPVRGGMLDAGDEGVALLLGPSDEESFLARVGIEFLEANTSVEVRVIDAGGTRLNAVVLSSAVPARWSGVLCEVNASPSQAGRVELSVLTGRAIGTAYRGGREYVTTIPILSRATVRAAGGGTAAISTSATRTPESSRSAIRTPESSTSASEGPVSVTALTGQSSYSGTYNWPGTNFVFRVFGGPPSTCGDIHTFRNGSWVIANGWICTDGAGNATKGPWYITPTFPGQNQTDNPTYIQWPNGTTTTQTWHVIDTIHPTVSIYTSGVKFHGTATAALWGSGFNAAWTSVQLFFQDDTTGLYWNSSFCPAPGWNCFKSGVPEYMTAAVNLSNTYPNPTVFQLSWLYQASYLYLEVGHHYSVHVKVNDMWGSGTLTWQFQ
jgi:hypothetical protein